jgi:hypothetical protein
MTGNNLSKYLTRVQSTIDIIKLMLDGDDLKKMASVVHDDTFSPITKMSSIFLFLAMPAMKCCPLFQLDIKNAFMHGDLEDEIYMEQPLSFVSQMECNLLCKLHASLYGLKQSYPEPFLGMCKELYGAESPIYGGLNYL